MASSDPQRARPGGQRAVVGVAESSGTTGLSDRTSPQRRNDESWVEVSSQPSSSSLSSIGDDIVTTGLRVGSGSYPPRRRRPQNRPMPASFIIGHAATHTGATSSQEEYDETESEEDRVITSSTEAMHPSANLLRQPTAARAGMDTDTDSDDDENATALGRPSDAPAFRPQPNAFSHPPSYLTHRHSTSSAHQYHPFQSRPSMPNRSHTRSNRGAHNLADNDAALRASLTTLLSCAAAARGLPKTNEPHQGGSPRTGPGGIGAGVLPSSQPMELRLVPESELMAEGPSPPSGVVGHGPAKAPLRTASNSSAPSAPCSNAGNDKEVNSTDPKSKRAATGQGKSTRTVKKKRTTSAPGFLDGEISTLISPTLMTWVVGAGVVVLVSVVGFGAGYVIGREVGRQEGSLGFVSAGSTANASANCGSDLVRSTSGGTLRRFRWGSMGRSVVA